MIDFYKKYFLDVAPQIISHLKPSLISEVKDRGIMMIFKADDLPIPISLGDIIKLNGEDYLIREFGHVHWTENNNKYCDLFVRKIDKEKEPEVYLKRKIGD